jgi:cysteine synthase
VIALATSLRSRAWTPSTTPHTGEEHGIFVGPGSAAQMLAGEVLRRERRDLATIVTTLADERERY